MRKLLIIADDWEALERYEEKLISHFDVLCAPFGSEGIKMAREEQPDRILIDLVFEDMSAEEACDLLRSEPTTWGIPIVAVDDQAWASAQFPKIAGDRLVIRPFEFSELVEVLTK